MTEFYNLLWEAVLLTSQCGTVGHRKTECSLVF